MRYFLIGELLFLLLTAGSCKPAPSVKSAVEAHPESWTVLKIDIEGVNEPTSREMWVIFDQDTSYCTTTYKEVTTNVGLGKINKHLVISRQEREKIMALALKAIKEPVRTYSEVSDYAGQYVTISMEYGATKLQCSYSSVDDWTAISPTLKELSRLTFDRAK